LRILSVSPFYEPEGGGLERYAHAILRRLVAQGHEAHAVAFSRTARGIEARDGVTVERSPAPFWVGNAPLDPAFRGRVRESIQRLRPDLVVAHTPVPFPAEMAYLAARKEGVPFVVTYHAGRLRGSTPWRDALARLDAATFERRMLAGATRLVAVGPFVRDHALARQRERVHIVPPGVDTGFFHPGDGRPSRDVLFVGPLSRSYRWKGVDCLWQALPRIRREVPDARLVLIGVGDRAGRFLARARPYGDAVELRGRVDEAGLRRAYQESAVTVLPSLTDAESFGMVLAEANACGRPVVGSRVGGIPDFVRHGDNGLLATPGDPADLAEKVVSILQDPAWGVKMGANGRERVVREHDWDQLAKRTLLVYEEAAATRTARAKPLASVSGEPVG
jgi:glycosyltransferase involved in cell wall biosynthesis